MQAIKLCRYELKVQIEILREEMISTALLEGLTSEQTISISQKLDDYISIYNSLENNNDFTYVR
jgi:hypothetical protein